MSVVALTGATTSIAQSTPGDVATSQLAIRSMTTIDQEGQGYFEDPYSVRLEPTLKSNMEIISGTTFAVMSCVYPLREDCFSWTPDKIKIGALTRDVIAAKAVVTTFQNLNVFQADNGKWHAVVAADVQARGDMSGKHWTVLLHAHPTTSAPPEVVPLSWTADTILSGSFSDDVQGNYDGKYFEDNGELYLLYVKNLIPEPALRNGIVIRRMISPRQFVSEAPTLLLAPGDRFGPLPSEKFGSTPARLVEAPFIIKLANTYALIYSTGDYMESDYKAGVAWSDTLIPANGGHYRKVLQEDVAGVWGQPGPAGSALSSPVAGRELAQLHPERGLGTRSSISGPVALRRLEPLLCRL